MAKDSRIALLLEILDAAYDRRSWHGANLRGALRGLSAREAARRPGAGRHNAWEEALHAAYWKDAVRRRIAGEKRGAFPLPGSNWFSSPGVPTEREWRAAVALLAETHRRLRAAVSSLDPKRLSRRAPGSRFTIRALIYGAAAHDLYHAGQIRLIRVLRASR